MLQILNAEPIAPDEFNVRYLRLVINFNQNAFNFTVDRRPCWFDGMRVESLAQFGFRILRANIPELLEIENGPVQERLKSLLRDSYFNGNSQVLEARIEEEVNADYLILHTERCLAAYLSRHSLLFRENRVSCKISNRNYSETIGGLVCARLIGDLHALSYLCDTLNEISIMRPVSRSGCKCHALIAIPLHVMKGRIADLERYLFEHPTTVILLERFNDRVRQLELHECFFIWATLAFRRDEHYEEEGIPFPPRGNLRTLFTNKGIAENGMPFWAQSNHALDDSHGILAAVTVFRDQICFTLPSGTRELGETSWEALNRHVLESIDVSLGQAVHVPDRSMSSATSVYKWIPELHARFDPNGGIQGYYVILTKKTDCDGDYEYEISLNEETPTNDANESVKNCESPEVHLSRSDSKPNVNVNPDDGMNPHYHLSSVENFDAPHEQPLKSPSHDVNLTYIDSGDRLPRQNTFSDIELMTQACLAEQSGLLDDKHLEVLDGNKE